MSRVHAWAVLLLLLVVAGAQRATAQLVLNPYVESHIEHDSNVFRAPNAQADFIAIGDSQLGDTDVEYLAGLDGTYAWSEQKLTAKFEVRRFDFEHYGDLDHNEYLGDVSLKWKLTSLLDGTLGVRQESAMAPFALGNSSELTINVDRNINGKLNLNFNPDWRLESGLYYHTLKSPLQDFPDFVEHELGTHLGIVNLSVARLTYGIGIDYLDGKYENAPDVGPYTQWTVTSKFNYEASALTDLNGSVGYTKRNQNANGGNTSAVTGAFGYSRQLTGKTSINIQLTRAVNSYVAAGASEIDTSVTVGVKWRATYKVDVELNGGYVHSTFVGEAVPGSSVNGRVDRIPTESLNVTYQVLRRLRLRGYVTKQERNSNIEFYNFNDTLVGIDAKLTWR